MSRRFVIIGVGVAFVVVCVGLVGFNIFRKTMTAAYFAHASRPPVTVEAASVDTVTWKPIIEAVGTTKAQMGADLAVEAAGVVEAIDFSAGETVKKGQLLVQIDDKQEQADMAAARANIVSLKRQYDRLLTLHKKGFAAQQDLDTAKASLDVAQSDYDHAKAMSDLKAVTAPFDGVIGIPDINVGQYLQVGTVVATLQNLDELKVDFTVPEQSAATVAVGDKAEFATQSGEMKYDGRIVGIDPKVDQTTHLVAVEALLDNPDHKVLPGQFLRVHVVLGDEPGVLAVPQTAVVTSLYGDYVYVVASEGQGKNSALVAKQTFVEAGRRAPGLIEIRSGLKAGDLVVSAGQNKLQNGAPIAISTPPSVSNAGGTG